jgi:glucosamine-6-phosphate deaminase
LLLVLPDAEAVARAAAGLVEDAVHAGATTLGLATGSSPLRTYARLARRCRDGFLSFAGCSAYLLDEYVGLDHRHPQSFGRVIRRDLIDSVDLPDERVHAPDGNASDLQVEAERYEKAVVSAAVDLQLLGLGANGHLGFNEPGSALDAPTRVVELSERTRRDNARFFDAPESVPRRAVTQGLGTITRAGRLVLMVHGEHKATALRDALEGPVTTACPASVLQQHPDVHVLADAAAASRIAR